MLRGREEEPHVARIATLIGKCVRDIEDRQTLDVRRERIERATGIGLNEVYRPVSGISWECRTCNIVNLSNGERLAGDRHSSSPINLRAYHTRSEEHTS